MRNFINKMYLLKNIKQSFEILEKHFKWMGYEVMNSWIFLIRKLMLLSLNLLVNYFFWRGRFKLQVPQNRTNHWFFPKRRVVGPHLRIQGLRHRPIGATSGVYRSRTRAMKHCRRTLTSHAGRVWTVHRYSTVGHASNPTPSVPMQRSPWTLTIEPTVETILTVILWTLALSQEPTPVSSKPP